MSENPTWEDLYAMVPDLDPEVFFVVHASEGVVQDTEVIFAENRYCKTRRIVIDYDDLDPLRDDMTDPDEVRTSVGDMLEQLRALPPGEERKRIRREVTFTYNEYRRALKEMEGQ